MSKKVDGRKNNGGNKNAGRKSRQEHGLPPTVTTGVRVERSVIDAARKNHKTLAAALRFAAKYKEDDLK